MFGMCPITNDFDLVYPEEYYTVMLDGINSFCIILHPLGRIIGYVEPLLVN